MESMTGYSHVEGSTGQFSFSVELKTLNSKYNEVFVNLPRSLSAEEGPIIDLLKKRLVRGKIELGVDVYDWSDSRSTRINSVLLQEYYKDICTFRKKFAPDEVFTLDSLISLDGIVKKGRSSITPQSRTALLTAVDNAIAKTIIMRKSEGKALGKDILSHVSAIEKDLTAIRSKSKTAGSAQFEKLKARIEKASGASIEDSRIYAEVAVYADRADISEEISRLTDHIRKFRECAREDGQIGKRMDFLAQEMFREANTIGSKTPSTEISHLAVNIKMSIEKIREQSRNVV